MVSAGRVLLMPKGDYNPATTYSMLDIVSYNGSSYIAKQSTTGNLPTNTTYWQLSAYGGSAANLAGNFATLETTAYASQDYDVDDFLVNKDNQFCKVISGITTGDEIIVDTNVEITNVGELIQAVISYADGLDAKNVKLNGAVAISSQTDLNDMTTIGNYYKSSTSFYVTNAPTGIASELTAVFRLTVENGSDTTNKYIQTLRTNDGKTYTRGYNGSAWGDWIEDASAASVALKQPKTLDTPITVGGTQETTVEGTLGALSSALTNQTNAMVNVYGSKNILLNKLASTTLNTVQYTKYDDGHCNVNGTNDKSDAATWFWLSGTNSDDFLLKAGTYILSAGTNALSTDCSLNLMSGSTYLAVINSSIDEVEFTLDADTYVRYGVRLPQLGSANNITIYPMIRDARIVDSTYEPYAMTNQEITEALNGTYEDITYENNSATCHLYLARVGKVVSVYIPETDLVIDSIAMLIKSGFPLPYGTDAIISCPDGNGGFMRLQINSTGNLYILQGESSATRRIFGIITYVCK